MWLWTEEVQQKVRAKKSAYKNWRGNRTNENWQEYVTAKKDAKRTVAKTRDSHYKNLYEQLDTKEGEKGIYRLARARAKAARDIEHYLCIKDKNGKRLQNKRDILKRWQQYFNEISNYEFDHPPTPEISPHLGPLPQISVEEVTVAIRKMKNSKAPGPDDLPSDLWKLPELNSAAATWLTDFFNAIVDCGRVPTEWTTSTTVPVFKNKGDPALCSNYRPIRLLSHTLKIFERVIDGRLRNIIQLHSNQCGFVKGRGTTDAIFAARQLLEKHHEKRKSLHMAFLDLEKAFERVPRQLIWYALRDHGVPELLIDWVRMLYVNTNSRVKCAAGTSDSFPIQVGVHQGSALSPLLFITIMDTITRDLQNNTPWTLLYADDVMLATNTRKELQEQVQAWCDRLSQFGLRLNITKTEYMETNPTVGTITVNGENLKKTTHFRYLGSVLQCDGGIERVVRARVNASWLRWREISGVLCDKKMPLRLKSKIYQTMIRPITLYGVECLPVTKFDEHRLQVMEMRMARWASGVSLLDHIQNNVIRQYMGIVPITNKMRERRLQWFGHVLRASQDKIISAAHHLEISGRWPRGRPKQRWRDTIKSDMDTTGLNPEDAHDRASWRSKIKTADPAPLRENAL